jgi:hypothetical protein
VEKYGRAGQATDDNKTQRVRFICWITKATDKLGICNTYLKLVYDRQETVHGELFCYKQIECSIRIKKSFNLVIL